MTTAADITSEDIAQQVVYNTAIDCGLTDTQARIIVGQATTESAHFASKVFNDDNNAFGMKYPSKRPTTYIAGKSNITMTSEGTTPYAHYDSLEDSVKDVILGLLPYDGIDWSTITTPDQYTAFLVSKGYYPASEQTSYTNDIVSIMQDIETTVKNNPVATGLITVALLIVGAFFIFSK
jgi:uncharacterized FlgJ-related protein